MTSSRLASSCNRSVMSRVVSIIPEICPFSNIPQPAMNQLDRDGDEITDDWEFKYDFNKYKILI